MAKRSKDSSINTVGRARVGIAEINVGKYDEGGRGMAGSETSAAFSHSSPTSGPMSISNERPVCLDSSRAISRRASRSLCWTCPDNRMTMGWKDNEVSASSRS